MFPTFVIRHHCRKRHSGTTLAFCLAGAAVLAMAALAGCSAPEMEAQPEALVPLPAEQTPERPVLPSDRVTTITPMVPGPAELPEFEDEAPPAPASDPAHLEDAPEAAEAEDTGHASRPEPPPVVVMAEPVETVTEIPARLEELEEEAAPETEDSLGEALLDARRRAEAARQKARTEWAERAAHTTLQTAETHMTEAARHETEDPQGARVAYELAAALFNEAVQMAEIAAQADAGAAESRAAALELRNQITEEVRSLAQQETVAADTAWNAAEAISDTPEKAATLYELAQKEYADALRVATERAAEAEADAAKLQEELAAARERAERARGQISDEIRQHAQEQVAEAEALWSRATQSQDQDPARAIELFEQARFRYEEAATSLQTAQRQAFVEELRAHAVTVAQDGTGDYSSINEAIGAVPADTPIFIRPGVYREAVTIDKPVALIGEGPVSEIRIESMDADCITINTSQAVIHGLTLRSSASFDSKGVYTVYCPQGRVLIEYCDIASDSLSAIAVHNPGTGPIIRNCNIHDSTQAGVFFYGGAEGVVENCEIAGNGLAGIQIKSGANPHVRQSKIRQNKGSGVFVNEGGLGVIENCEITQNTLAGISIAIGGNPTVRECTIAHNRRYGVRVYDEGRGTIENCTFSNNEPANWLIAEGCEVARANNRE